MSSNRVLPNRAPFWFVILPPILSFLSGLILGSYLLYLPCSIFLLLVAFGVALVCLERLNRITIKKSAILFTSVILGIVWWMAIASFQSETDISRWVHKEPVKVVGEVVEPVRRALDRLVLVIDVSHIGYGEHMKPTSGLLRLTWREAKHSVHRGNHIEVVARLREPYGTLNPGGFHYGQFLKRKGIQAVATVSGPGKVQVRETSNVLTLSRFWERIDAWREQVYRAASATLTDPALGLFLGMIVGEQNFITSEVRDAFMATGTVHIISISGSHLGLIAFLLFFCVKGAVLRLPMMWLEWLSLRITATRLAVLVTIPVVSFYTLLAGGEIATVRSWIMIVLFLLAVWMGREKHILTALGVAAFLVTVSDPQVIYDTSFQLSYSAVLAIALVILMTQAKTEEEQEVSAQFEQWGGFVRQWIQQTLWLTLAVTLATLPLVAYYFNQIAWLGLVCNLLVVPFVGFLVIPLGLLSVGWVLMTGTETLPLAFFHQTIADMLVNIVTVLAKFPGAEWYVGSPAILMIILFYGLLLTVVLCPGRSKVQMSCAIGLFAILVLWAWSPRWGMERDTVRITFLDVGQGDATVIELPENQTVLIDGGPAYRRLDMGQAVIGPYLWDRGIRRIDHVIATHPQWDHVGGLPWIFKKFDVGQFWSNGIAREQVFYQRLQRAIRQAGVKKQVPQKGQEIADAGPCTIKAVSPLRNTGHSHSFPSIGVSGADLNNQSIMTKLDCGLHSFLLTADAEVEALSQLNEFPDARTARVVKIPHHGAKSSLHPEWINQLDAEVVVVSVGKHNRYGHPYPSVLEAYAHKNIPLYRTDRDGAVWITAHLNSPNMTIHTAQVNRLQPVQLDISIWRSEKENLARLWRQWTGEV